MKNKLNHCLILVPLLILAFIQNVYSLSDTLKQEEAQLKNLQISTFDIDATPPLGSHMAYDLVQGSWEMGLRARGIVLLGAGRPVVLCSVDWIGIANKSQDEFKRV